MENRTLTIKATLKMIVAILATSRMEACFGLNCMRHAPGCSQATALIWIKWSDAVRRERREDVTRSALRSPCCRGQGDVVRNDDAEARRALTASQGIVLMFSNKALHLVQHSGEPRAGSALPGTPRPQY